MKIFIADFETTPFDYNANSDYFLHSRFICFKRIYPIKLYFKVYYLINHKYIHKIYEKELKRKFYFNIEKNGKQKIKKFILDNCSIGNPCRVYFHNLRFDLAFLYELLPKEYKYHVIRNNSNIISFRVFKERERINKNGRIRIVRDTLFEIRDSLVLLLSSISKLGKSLGFSKMEIDYNIKKITKEYIDYCYRDIEIIEIAFNKIIYFLKKFYDYDLSIKNFPLTLPSLGKRVFHITIKKKFGKHILDKIYYNFNFMEKYESKYRDYYYGGRVEVFNFNCCFNGYYNDFNSHYGSIMIENEFPLTPYEVRPCNESSKCFNNWKKNKNIFACLCNVYENLEIPLVATKINDKLTFAKGKKKCLLFRKEIEYLLSLNQKIEILEIIVCNGYLPIFDVFVKKAFKIKALYKHNEFEYYFAKIFMLALYGKFAEKREKENIEIIQSIKGLTNAEIRQSSYTDKGIIKRSVKIHNAIRINVFYSMMIASLSRLKLHKEICKSMNPFYCDSDSIVSTDLIENSKEIGHLKPEFTFLKFQALGCKEYIIEKIEVRPNPIIRVPLKDIIVKMKGFGRITSNNFSFFISHFKDGKKQNRMIGFMEAFNRDLPFNIVLVYNKFKISVYDKRFINSDLTTRAFDLNKDNYDDLIKNNEYYIQKILNDYSNVN